MDYLTPAEALFPHLEYTKERLLNEIYPPRPLPEGAVVTRFAPSPTGFMHIGNVYAANAANRAAKATAGVMILRIEDTDKKREVEGGVPLIIESLGDFGIAFDEGPLGQGGEKGQYGPYIQSARKPLYHAFCRDLVEQGHAYPCFCTPEELDELRQRQEALGLTPGYWGEFAPWRDRPWQEAAEKLDAGVPYVIRLRSPGKPGGRIGFKDLIRGDIEMEENFSDVVLLKSDGLPTYHFAHIVDDTLMRVTHVVRGEEWIASAPIHLQMFRLCGLKAPKYAHVSPIMKDDEGSRRKLSKRKDPEAAATFFHQQGYPAEAVIEYLLTIANSNFEEWRKQNSNAPYTDFPFRLNKMSPSGALFDLVKLNSVSAIYISKLTAGQVLEQGLAWSQKHDAELHHLLNSNLQKAKAIFTIDRGGNKPRKDITRWGDVSEYISYLYANTFVREEPAVDSNIDGSLQRALLTDYIQSPDFAAATLPGADKDAWFQGMKDLAARHGFSPDVKAYKTAPDQFNGHVGDVSGLVRLAITGRRNTPDLCAIMGILGQETCRYRITDYLKHRSL